MGSLQQSSMGAMGDMFSSHPRSHAAAMTAAVPASELRRSQSMGARHLSAQASRNVSSGRIETPRPPPPREDVYLGHSCSTETSRREYTSTATSRRDSWDRDTIDIEAGCNPWIHPREDRLTTLLRTSLFGSRVQRKCRNPAACDSIDYNIRITSHVVAFFWRTVFFFAYCFLLSLYHLSLGFSCGNNESGVRGKSLTLIWAETLVATGTCFLLAQGYFGMRASRERMERVRQTAVTLAYSFIKTTNTDNDIGLAKNELQVLIYECLALLTAYPVALLHQMRGNTCEPAITRYCQEVARALQRLRNGEEAMEGANPGLSFGHGAGRQQFATVDYFYEVFSLHLEMEYERQSMRTKTPSMASQYIIYNLRNHFENIVDLGNLDDRRTPIIRENIDMLAMAARECSVFAYTDVVPLAFLWAVDLAARLLAFATPVQNCDWIINATNEQGFQFPRFFTLLSMVSLAMMCATLLTVVDEMWRMWDPFGRGMNTFAWTLGIAIEIDNMLNEFYEHDTKVLIRKHAYMDPPRPRNEAMMGDGERLTV